MSVCPICELTKSCKCHEAERILHASVIAKDGRIFFGKCHADCFYKGQAMGVAMSSKSNHQGFITNKGRYVDRQEAAQIAFQQKQIDLETGYLFSEDMWSDRDNGKYDHDEINGYVLKQESKE